MAVPESPNLASQAATHYQVLNLSPSLLDSQQDPAPLIKRAYHRALLRNHPDKASSSASPSPQPDASSTLTIDQITTALAVLSSPAKRAAYDACLRVARPGAADQLRSGGGGGADFQTGVETVDLDDLAFDEAGQCWFRPCRCGNERSYIFREADLEEVAADDGGAELVVACLDCSLWLRVHFAVMDDEEQQPGAEGFEPDSNSKEKG